MSSDIIPVPKRLRPQAFTNARSAHLPEGIITFCSCSYDIMSSDIIPLSIEAAEMQYGSRQDSERTGDRDE